MSIASKEKFLNHVQNARELLMNHSEDQKRTDKSKEMFDLLPENKLPLEISRWLLAEMTKIKDDSVNSTRVNAAGYVTQKEKNNAKLAVMFDQCERDIRKFSTLVECNRQKAQFAEKRRLKLEDAMIAVLNQEHGAFLAMSRKSYQDYYDKVDALIDECMERLTKHYGHPPPWK